MGSVTGLSMASDVIHPVHEAQAKPVHPFFVSNRSTNKPSRSTAAEANVVDGRPSEKGKGKPAQTLKRREPAPETDVPDPLRKKKCFRKQAAAHSERPSISGFDGANDEDKPPQEVAQVPTAPPSLPSNQKTENDRPKKLLQYNRKTGTLGSPPKRKPSVAQEDAVSQIVEQPPGGNGRREQDSLVVRVKYGTDTDRETRERVGQRIDGLLANEVPTSSSSSNESTAKVTPKRSAPGKANVTPIKIHPLFLGKQKCSSPLSPNGLGSPTLPPRVRRFSVSPVSSRRAAAVCAKVPVTKAPIFSISPSANRKHGPLFPHAKHAAWPGKGMVHVQPAEEPVPLPGDDSMVPSGRKGKGHLVKISVAESILHHLVRQLDIPSATEEFAPPRELRLPAKHFESGRKLQIRIQLQLKSWTRGHVGHKGHGDMISPQLGRLHDSIRDQTSAFDRSECETACWTHKYAPEAAIEILQAGREAFLLKEWLQALQVQSVDTGSEGLDAKEKKKSRGAPKKGKKRKKTEGFIVSSDDEDDVMDELSDTDYRLAPSGMQAVARKTVIRSGDVKAKGKDGTRLTNTVVISGPRGCGKTATVYAVAKELGFEVFELNPGSRRNGKDVLEKIGDMTRNHLVKHHGTADDKDGPAGDEEDNDIKSGKQATMKAFFKPKAPAAPKAKKAAKAKAVAAAESKKAVPKMQKQSLILLEEADILFAEDKHFWSCVMDLITQSKRPFVVTCNDETLIPLQSLNLHAIFRLSPPPVDVAVDRLLLVAANEGHALKRDAVQGLYESRQYDLRAALLDLQYWCQMGVGDQKGGLGWFYPRGLQGTCLDEHGDVIRVVSEDTYRPGMGFFSHDLAVCPQSMQAVEEDIIRQTWDSVGLDMSNWENMVGLREWAENSSRSGPDALKAFEEFTATMSLADVCSRGSFAGFHEELLDPTLPEPSAKTNDDLVLGFQSFGTPTMSVHDANPTSTSLITSITMKTLARNVLFHHGTSKTPRPVLDEATALHCMLHQPLASERAISRADFSLALDPIAATEASLFSAATSTLDASVLDGTLRTVVLDVAPYIRGIMAYEARLRLERSQLGSVSSEGGRGGGGRGGGGRRGGRRMRMRTTRAALSALEGGSRSTTRPERWFRAAVNAALVMRTGGEGWQDWPTDEAESRQGIEGHESEPDSEAAEPVMKRRRVVRDGSVDELGDD